MTEPERKKQHSKLRKKEVMVMLKEMWKQRIALFSQVSCLSSCVRWDEAWEAVVKAVNEVNNGSYDREDLRAVFFHVKANLREKEVFNNRLWKKINTAIENGKKVPTDKELKYTEAEKQMEILRNECYDEGYGGKFDRAGVPLNPDNKFMRLLRAKKAEEAASSASGATAAERDQQAPSEKGNLATPTTNSCLVSASSSTTTTTTRFNSVTEVLATPTAPPAVVYIIEKNTSAQDKLKSLIVNNEDKEHGKQPVKSDEEVDFIKEEVVMEEDGIEVYTDIAEEMENNMGTRQGSQNVLTTQYNDTHHVQSVQNEVTQPSIQNDTTQTFTQTSVCSQSGTQDMLPPPNKKMCRRDVSQGISEHKKSFYTHANQTTVNETHPTDQKGTMNAPNSDDEPRQCDKCLPQRDVIVSELHDIKEAIRDISSSLKNIEKVFASSLNTIASSLSDLAFAINIIKRKGLPH